MTHEFHFYFLMCTDVVASSVIMPYLRESRQFVSKVFYQRAYMFYKQEYLGVRIFTQSCSSLFILQDLITINRWGLLCGLKGQVDY